MKTIEKKYYVCEVCGKSSTDEEKIRQCQEKHRIINDNCEVECDYRRGEEVPRDILITFPDGARAGYILNFFDDKEGRK